jgi:hypothetical protein
MVQNSKAENSVEGAVFLQAQISHVILHEVEIIQGQSLLHEACFSQIRLPYFHSDSVCAVLGRLDLIQTFQARQIENAGGTQRIR